MPDYRISSAKLLRLALLASGGDTPKFDEVFGILREAQPVLDADMVVKKQLADATSIKGGAITADKLYGGDQSYAAQGLPEARPLPPLATGTASGTLTPVTGDEASATGTADLAPTKPE